MSSIGTGNRNEVAMGRHPMNRRQGCDLGLMSHEYKAADGGRSALDMRDYRLAAHSDRASEGRPARSAFRVGFGPQFPDGAGELLGIRVGGVVLCGKHPCYITDFSPSNKGSAAKEALQLAAAGQLKPLRVPPHRPRTR